MEQDLGNEFKNNNLVGPSSKLKKDAATWCYSVKIKNLFKLKILAQKAIRITEMIAR